MPLDMAFHPATISTAVGPASVVPHATGYVSHLMPTTGVASAVGTAAAPVTAGAAGTAAASTAGAATAGAAALGPWGIAALIFGGLLLGKSLGLFGNNNGGGGRGQGYPQQSQFTAFPPPVPAYVSSPPMNQNFERREAQSARGEDGVLREVQANTLRESMRKSY